MSYFSVADLEERLRGTGVTPSQAEIDAARSFAQGFVDASLTKRYRVPFSPVPDVVRFVALDIAAYDILSKHFVAEDPNVGDLIEQYWNRARETLAALAEGSMRLDGAAVDEPCERRVLRSRSDGDTVFRLRDSVSGEQGTMEEW